MHREDRHFEEFFQYGEMLNGIIATRREGGDEEIITWLANHSSDAFIEENAQPQLVASEGDYNIVQVGWRYVAVSKTLGHIDLRTERIGQRDVPPLVSVADSCENARRKVRESGWRM